MTEIPPWAIAEPHVAGGLRGPRIRHFKDAQKKPIGLDWIGTGGQVVAPPSLHKSGERRRWFVDIEEVITLPFGELWDIVAKLARNFGAVNLEAHAHTHHSNNGKAAPQNQILDRAAKYLAKCSPAISGQGGHDATLVAARAMAWGFDLGPDGAFDLLSAHYNPRCVPPWTEAELRHKCRDADTIPYDKPRGWLRDAERNDQRNAVPSHGSSAVSEHPESGDVTHDAAKIKLTDRGNAIRLAHQHGRDLRYCWPWHKWLVWDGTRWRLDDTGSVVRCAKQTIAGLFEWATNRIQEPQETLKEAADG